MAETIVGYQTWRDLLFVHWRTEPDQMQALLPSGLRIETFDGSAWLGLVPFSMERVRPWWSPPVPGISWFLETNVRTYVRHENGQTGVWFFSLDANQRLAVAVARKFWHLNYQFAKMTLHRDGSRMSYSGKRPSTSGAEYCMVAEFDDFGKPATAEVGSLEHFLLERYHLFAQRPDGRFLCAQVHHDPYTWQPTELQQISQSLTDAMGYPISPDIAPDHVTWSPGVDVSVSDLKLVER